MSEMDHNGHICYSTNVHTGNLWGQKKMKCCSKSTAERQREQFGLERKEEVQLNTNSVVETLSQRIFHQKETRKKCPDVMQQKSESSSGREVD
ncbi:hypothetical protein PHYBLDRAFT_152068 [Phycomyces blakesleeanus NRRL 1555(-)]|uniref:Uncharacterized protein n=1 Tax=Phycomyces blakesleeanus (strain ATCC 8743b / DSM 1359 / FGSC 10004 / NBRC 33097 / NRRL 1555) TaxID=763407 RepID=A0A167JW39_PHYB8|nr:hypothetical protein PHYBLDRAFT_152068 [Phycomyces blakesleeanus NRRL 1555(-)]OAD66798.1 hypothetical protein PHYBLDRAFT_152068 [Phycomyces blakesleeanus NRRL 1555(-)]|eukprot:XP_018284838.1 hypothetical protein PHYBLDRAFT_152068 [Phycomyces blakesleeanus NRRL 1555(-)]